MILVLGVLYKELEDRRPNVVIAPVERNFLRHLADANLKKTSVEYKHLKFLIPHLKKGLTYFKMFKTMTLFLFCSRLSLYYTRTKTSIASLIIL